MNFNMPCIIGFQPDCQKKPGSFLLFVWSQILAIVYSTRQFFLACKCTLRYLVIL